MTEDNVLKRKITDCDNLIKKTSDIMQHLDFSKSQVEFYTNILYWILNTRGAFLSYLYSSASHIIAVCTSSHQYDVKSALHDVLKSRGKSLILVLGDISYHDPDPQPSRSYR